MSISEREDGLLKAYGEQQRHIAKLTDQVQTLRDALVDAACELLSYDASYGGGGGQELAFDLARLLGYEEEMSAEAVENWLFKQRQASKQQHALAAWPEKPGVTK